jgi:hypothetical protein
MMDKTKYVVWKRSDGYVDSSCNYLPNGWKSASGEQVTFTHLKTFDVWGNECVDFIEAMRKETNYVPLHTK